MQFWFLSREAAIWCNWAYRPFPSRAYVIVGGEKRYRKHPALRSVVFGFIYLNFRERKRWSVARRLTWHVPTYSVHDSCAYCFETSRLVLRKPMEETRSFGVATGCNFFFIRVHKYCALVISFAVSCHRDEDRVRIFLLDGWNVTKRSPPIPC